MLYPLGKHTRKFELDTKVKLFFKFVVTNVNEVNVDETVNTTILLLLEPSILGCMRCSCSSVRDDTNSTEGS